MNSLAPRKAKPRPSAKKEPAPAPPVPPGLDDCCRSGCTPCVFDLYEEALDRYRAELAQWEARRAAHG